MLLNRKHSCIFGLSRCIQEGPSPEVWTDSCVEFFCSHNGTSACSGNDRPGTSRRVDGDCKCDTIVDDKHFTNCTCVVHVTSNNRVHLCLQVCLQVLTAISNFHASVSRCVTSEKKVRVTPLSLVSVLTTRSLSWNLLYLHVQDSKSQPTNCCRLLFQFFFLINARWFGR